MKPEQKLSKDNKTWKIQLSLTMLFVGLPIFMIIFNGKNALNTILWNPDNAELNVVQSKVSQKEINSKKGFSYDQIDYGVYDPANTFKDYQNFKFEVVYINWINYDKDKLENKLISIKSQNRIPFVFCEPWHKESHGDSYLKDITYGAFDKDMDKLTQVLNNYGIQIYLSWGHEMDQDLTHRYPWSGADQKDFIDAYRYVFNYFEERISSNITWIWSPVGKGNFVEYFPGKKFVDIIGLPVYSFPEWDRSYYGYIRDFETTFSEKYKKLGSMEIPVYIAEFGVTGSDEFTSFWMSQAFRSFKQFENLKGVIFFYSEDTPDAWGSEISTPDWRIHKGVISGLVDYYSSMNKNSE